MVRKTVNEKVEHLAGGKGTAEVQHLVSKEELLGAGAMYAKVVLPPGASVGWHTHVGETEPYYILSGKGEFTDNDGTKTVVGPGDVCVIVPGQSHSIDNISDTENLEFMAMIYYDHTK